MKKVTFLTAIAAITMFATSCGHSSQDPFLLVPGERAGLFVLNQKCEPVETLYKDYGYRQEIDDWSAVNILHNDDLVVLFYPMLEEGGDSRIENTVGNSIGVYSSDFRTAEKIGVGSSLDDLLRNYSKYKIKITFTPEEDYAPIKTSEYENINEFLEYILQNGTDGIDFTSFICLDANKETTGIIFYFNLEGIDNPETLKKESKITHIVIREPNYQEEEGTAWM